jgi:cysteine desulfurase/selenocysteine lyase
VKHIPITDDGQLDLNGLELLLTERTKIVSLTVVSNVLGTMNPLDKIIAAAHAVGAVVLLDAAQSVPHMPTDVQALNCDFLAFSGHKLLAPSGVGVLWGRQNLLDAKPPFLGGGSMIRRVHLDRFEAAELPAKFEAGTPPIVSAIGLGAALDYLQAIGLDNIHAYEQQLARRAHELLSDLGGVRFLGPSVERKAGIVSFTLDGIHPHDVAQLLDRHGIAVRAGHHCAMTLHKRLSIHASTRASFYFYNTVAEVERFAAALADVKKVLRRR